jgi:hypothetical protein
MRQYEKHEEREGKPQSHAFAKELIAGFAGAEADKLFETKGLSFLDREEAKRHARQQVRGSVPQNRGATADASVRTRRSRRTRTATSDRLAATRAWLDAMPSG